MTRIYDNSREQAIDLMLNGWDYRETPFWKMLEEIEERHNAQEERQVEEA